MAQVAFVFAGQGAQYPGMGRDLYQGCAAAREIFDRAEAIRPGTLDMCFNGSADDLAKTIHTQPCLFAMDWACAAAAVAAGAQPAVCAGFSLGEAAAAGFAGVMDFDQAFRFVIRRAEEMQLCAEKVQGAMGAALRLTNAQVEAICSEFNGDAHPVNYNCPGQIVVACREAVYDALAARITAEKGRIMRLKVGGAFHTPWMRGAGAALADYLSGQDLKSPAIPLYANFNARPYGKNAAEMLSKQVYHPVLWQQIIENMGAVDLFVEVGAGKTLSGLIRKILPGAQVVNVEKARDIEKLKEAL